jgi:hypothetical protein
MLSSRISRSVKWWFPTDLSGQPTGPIFKGRPLQIRPMGCPEASVRNYHFYAVENPKIRWISFTSRRKPEIIQETCEHILGKVWGVFMR